MKVALAKDLAEDAKLAKRTHAELCRQQRVFNARNRIIGVRPESEGKGEGQGRSLG